MQKLLIRFVFLVAVVFITIESKPMESLENYNVIIVHGAAFIYAIISLIRTPIHRILGLSG